MKKSLQYYMRLVHRVLGYLAVGMVLVYAISGITLIHRMGDFMKRGHEVTLTLKPDMNADELAAALKIKHLKASEETDEAIVFATGKYNRQSGEVTYVKKEYVTPIDKFVDLHKLPDAKNPHIAFATTLFGIVMLLLALTSLFMYPTKSRQFKANMIYTAAGVALTVLLLICL